MAQMDKQKGALIVFEGIDGTGKSTQIQHLARCLEASGHKVWRSFEPTQNQWGKILRDSMISGRLSLEEELDLFVKDRQDHVENYIKPHLTESTHVLLDRYYFSMMAYQGARGFCPRSIRERNEEFALQPDLVLWLDIPVESALARVGGRGEANEFEKKDQLQKCREIFSSIQEDWFVRVDASGTPDEVSAKVNQVVREKLPHLFPL